MKKKITVIGACSLAGVVVAVALFSNGQANEDNSSKNTLVAQDEVETEVQTPVASGNINISSVGVSSIIDSIDSTNDALNEITGNISYYNVGFADVVEEYNNYLYGNMNVSDEEKQEAVKDMDIATEIVPEDSVINGYTNLGISNAKTYLNVRNGAGTSYKIVGKMPGYSVCEVLEEKDGWYKIKSGDVTGYVSKDYVGYGGGCY